VRPHRRETARASLRGARFSGTCLRAADLRDTDLTAARFGATGERVHVTDLTGARLDGATLRGTTFEDVLGLPTV